MDTEGAMALLGTNPPRLEQQFHLGEPGFPGDLVQWFSNCGPQDLQHQHPAGIC